jgi:hypothetical protein
MDESRFSLDDLKYRPTGIASAVSDGKKAIPIRRQLFGELGPVVLYAVRAYGESDVFSHTKVDEGIPVAVIGHGDGTHHTIDFEAAERDMNSRYLAPEARTAARAAHAALAKLQK